MVDFGIKKNRILRKDIPVINSKEQGYEIRYRIISEDKNRTSHWSPILKLQPNYIFQSGNIDFKTAGKVVTNVWDPVKIKIGNVIIDTAQEYDIWVKCDKSDNGDWVYKERVQSNSFNMLHPTTYTINGVDQNTSPNRYSVEVYLVGTPISRDSSFLRVYQDGPDPI